jgi:hypothetical protein
MWLGCATATLLFSVMITTLPTVVTDDCDVPWTDDIVNFQTVWYKSLFHSVQSDCSSMSPILLRCYREGIFCYSKQPAAFLFLMQRSCDQLSDISHFVLATNLAYTDYYCLLGHGFRPFYPYTGPLGSMLAVPYLRPLVAGFPPLPPGFEPRLDNVGFVVDKVALGQVFSEHFGFPCKFSYHRLLYTHHLSPGAGTIGHLVADVPSGLSLTSAQETTKKKLGSMFLLCLSWLPCTTHWPVRAINYSSLCSALSMA